MPVHNAMYPRMQVHGIVLWLMVLPLMKRACVRHDDGFSCTTNMQQELHAENGWVARDQRGHIDAHKEIL